MRSLLRWLLLLLLVYPLALGTALAIDAAFGELRFADLLLYDSRRRLLMTVILDGCQAALWSVPLTLAGFALVQLFPRGARLPLLSLALVVLAATILWPQIPQMLGLVVAYSLAVPLLSGRRVVL